jgi:hypothetical protein
MMDSSCKDAMLLTMATANKYGDTRRSKREHRVHPYIAEKVLTYSTSTASQDLIMYQNKFKKST